MKIHKILFFFIYFFIQRIYCLNGVLWSKKFNKFISIFEVPNFYKVRTQLLAQSYELETHNFKKHPIRLLFHEEQGIITLYDNNTQVRGFLGEIYHFLSEYANFTLILKAVPDKRVGIRPTLTSGYNGLLRYIEQNSSDIIAKTEVYAYWLDVVDFFLPLWNDRFRLFAQSSYYGNAFWIANLFENDVWIAIIFIYALFLSIGIFAKIYILKHKIGFHILKIQKSTKILNTCACLFSMLILSFYSAKILYLMVNEFPFEPFNGIQTLLSKTDYIVLSEKDSVIHLAYEFLIIYTDVDPDQPLRPLISSKRIKFLPTRDIMYSLGCNSDRHYALLESEYLKQNIEKYGCEYVPMRETYFHTWIAGGIRRNFTYKRTLDRGILKLFESGILNGLKKRLIGLKKIHLTNPYQPIDLNKINTLIGIFIIGIILSVILLIVEEVHYYLKRRSKLRNIKRQLQWNDA